MPVKSYTQVQLLKKRKALATSSLPHLNIHLLGVEVLGSPFNLEVQNFIETNRKQPQIAIFSPRYSYKTLTVRGFIVQELLKNPDLHIIYVSQGLELSSRAVNSIGQVFLTNDTIRDLMATENKPPKGKKWLLDGEFSLPGRSDLTDKTPSLIAASTGQDITGWRADLVVLDDILSRKTVKELGGLDNVDSWYRTMVVPALGATGRTLCLGTFWSNEVNDLYQQFISSPWWLCTVRGLLETDKHPDKDGKLIDLWIREGETSASPIRPINDQDVQIYKDKLKSDFGPQMLNIATEDGDKPWDFDEGTITTSSAELAGKHRTTVVLIDPAPIGTTINHDYWANAVVGVFDDKSILRRVLLDGRCSQSWDVDKGIQSALDLASYWNSAIIGVEEPPSARNAKFYKTRIEELARRRGQRVEVVIFKAQMAKAHRIADLISMLRTGTFQVCHDTINSEYRNMFLFQGKNFPSPGHDDVIDAVAYINDPALGEHLPTSRRPIYDNPLDEESNNATQYKSGFRFC
jgi:hypothetical protein